MAMSTKDDERKAVEKIRGIIKGLGEWSYVGAALSGCLEIAESNIENDFGDSMEARWKDSQNELIAVVKQRENLIKELDNEKKKNDAMKKALLTGEDMEAILELVMKRVKTLDKYIKDAAEGIVDAAENPDGQDFFSSVNWHRASKKEREACIEIMDRLRPATEWRNCVASIIGEKEN